MTYYLVGGSAYDTSDYFLGTFMDAGGNSEEWGTQDFVRGDIEDDDPFWSLGLDTGVNPITRGNKQVEFGLFDNYRIKITTSGIFGWVGPGDNDFAALGGGAHTHDGDTLQLDGINSDGGAFPFNTTGAVDFNQDVGVVHGKSFVLRGYTAGEELQIYSSGTTAGGKVINQVVDGSLTIKGFHSLILGTNDGGSATKITISPTVITASVPIAMGSGQNITSADEDLAFTFGRLKTGSLWADSMCISHRDNYTTSSYAYRQLQTGETSINAKSGSNIILRNNGLTKVTVNSAGMTMNAPIAMGSNKISGLTAGSASGEAVEYDQLHAESHAMDNATYHTSSDVTILNASTSKHGFLKKLNNVSTQFMNGKGNWATPAGSLLSHFNVDWADYQETKTDVGRQLNTTNTQVRVSFQVPWDCDDSQNIIIRFPFYARSTDTSCTNYLHLGTRLANNTQGRVYDVESTTAFPINMVDGTYGYKTYTLAAANYSAGDIIAIAMQLYEADRTIDWLPLSVQYTTT